MRSNKFWIALLGGVLLISALIAFLLKQSPSYTARIYQDGVLIKRLDLTNISEPYSIVVENDAGFNTIAVEPGRLCIVEADCPDGYCVRQGWSNGRVPIVCLPHRLVIEFDGGSAPDIDAVVG